MLRRILPLLILAAAVAGFLYLRATGPTAPPPLTSERSWPVRALVIERGTHSPSIELFGRVQSPQTALLRAAVTGEVLEVPVRAGDWVPTGGLLVRIDDREAELQFQSRQADWRETEAALAAEQVRIDSDRRALARERNLQDIAQRGLERVRDLRSRNLGSEADLDAAQRTLEQAQLAVELRQLAVTLAPSHLAQAQARQARAQAALARAELDRQRIAIRAGSPVRIAALQVSVGERVREGDPLLRVYAPDDLEIQVSLPDTILPAILKFLAQGIPLTAQGTVAGQTVTAELVRVAGEVRSGEAGVGAWFRVTHGAEVLPLNRFVALRLFLPATENVIAIPFEALYGQDRLYRILEDAGQGERLQGLTVERLGEMASPGQRTQALVRHPALQSGDRIVATRLPNAMDGLRVEVVDLVPSGTLPASSPSPAVVVPSP
jgi:multidrug resistance efflux pump